jgi:hypothetical protein
MDFTESDEHAMLRAAAGDVAAGFGHDWFREQAESFQEYMRRTHNPEFTARTAWPVG